MKRVTVFLIACSIASFISLGQTAGGLVTVITAVGKGLSIVSGLKGFFTSNQHKMTDITPPGLRFDSIKDDSKCQLLQRMKESDLDIVVADLVKEFKDPQEMKKGVILGKLTPANSIAVKEFGFEVGKGGIAKFGFIATLKHEDNTFDLAMCMQSLDFKL